MSESFKWQNFFELAETLRTQDSSSEAALRTAISRSYYAAYHCAKNANPELFNQICKTGSLHSPFWNAMRKLGGRNTQLGAKGRRLLEARHMADYDNPFIINNGTESTFESIEKKAEEVALDAEMLVKAFSSNSK